jgi:hypothetical protein
MYLNITGHHNVVLTPERVHPPKNLTPEQVLGEGVGREGSEKEEVYNKITFFRYI